MTDRIAKNLLAALQAIADQARAAIDQAMIDAATADAALNEQHSQMYDGERVPRIIKQGETG